MNIAIVGAGKGGKALLQSLTKIEDISVSIIIDTNINALGISLAKKLGVKYSNDLNDMECINLDMIIEATGNSDLVKKLNNEFSNKCKIIDSHGAYLIMTLVEKNNQTLDNLNRHLDLINDASSHIETQLININTSVERIYNVSENLINTAEISSKYIEKSDKIIQYVNKIAKQTKILGLNANIEAARAGEHGKGFSVVANEIQKMASSSEEFASEINDILMHLSEEIKNINKETDSLNTLSQNQLNSSEQVSAQIKRLNSQKENLSMF